MKDEVTPGSVPLNDQLGRASEAPQPVAYLYHDAATAELADPLTHSVMLVMRRHRLPSYRNETPLVTMAQADAMVAAEREQCAKACEAIAAALKRDGLREQAFGAMDCAGNLRLRGWPNAAINLRR